MQIYEVDQTLSYTGSSANTVRELTLPGNVSFEGLMFRFDGYGAGGSTAALSTAFNSLKIQVSGQSPVTEVLNETNLDNITNYYSGLLVDRSITQNINNYSDVAAADATNGNWFIFPWRHSGRKPIKIVMDLDLSGNVFGEASAVTVQVGMINPGSMVDYTYVMSSEGFTSSTTTENVNLPAWGSDETLVAMDSSNAISRISAPALGINIDYPGLYGPNWQFTTNQGVDTDGFAKYLIEQTIVPQTGSDTLNFTKSIGATGTVFFIKAVRC